MVNNGREQVLRVPGVIERKAALHIYQGSHISHHNSFALERSFVKSLNIAYSVLAYTSFSLIYASAE